MNLQQFFLLFVQCCIGFPKWIIDQLKDMSIGSNVRTQSTNRRRNRVNPPQNIVLKNRCLIFLFFVDVFVVCMMFSGLAFSDKPTEQSRYQSQEQESRTGIKNRNQGQESVDEVLESFKSALENMGPIPKRIHATFRMTTEQYLASKSGLATEGLQRLALMSPGWDFKMYQDEEVEAYLKDKLQPEDYSLLEKCKFVEKSDLWRLLILYNEGGLYADIDRLFKADLNEFIGDDTRMLLPTWGNQDFAQSLMCSAPHNPVFAEAIKLNLEMRRNKIGGILDRGPRAYCRAVMNVVFGLKGQCLGTAARAQKIRETLHKIKGLKTYKETGECDRILFELEDGEHCDLRQWRKNKEDFYEELKVVHWSKASKK